MKNFITVFPLLVLLAVAACTGNSTFERQLAVADSLMRHHLSPTASDGYA